MVFVIAVVLIAAAFGVSMAVFRIPVENIVMRDYKVTFKRGLPKDRGLHGKPMVFYAGRFGFYFVGGMIALMLVMVIALTIYSGIISKEPRTAWLIAGLLIFALAMFIVLLAVLGRDAFGKLYLYQNGYVWRSLRRTETRFFYQLDGLRLGKKKGAYVSYNAYEFYKGRKTMLKLPVNVYKNIVFLEDVFTENHPCVSKVTGETLKAFKTSLGK